MKRSFLPVVFLLTLLVLPSGVAASNIILNQERGCLVTPREFKIGVTNNLTEESRFSVRTTGPNNEWAYINDRTLELEAGETGLSTIDVIPTNDAAMGKYDLTVSVFSLKNRSIESREEICFIVLRNYSIDASNFTAENTFKPDQEITASINTKNTGSRDFETVNFLVNLTREGENINSATASGELETEEQNQMKTSFELDRYQAPGTYELSYRITARGNIFDQGKKDISIEEVKGIETNEVTSENPLFRSEMIEIKNTGNVVYNDKITRKIDRPYNYLLTSKDVERESAEGGSIFKWETGIEPGESKTVEYQINYWPIYILIAILIYLAYRTFLYLQKPVIVKEIRKTELRENESIFTISLEIKNGVIGRAKNVVVKDFVPAVARVQEDFEGGIKPDVEKTEEGTELTWKLGQIGSGEERILHYKVKPLLEAVDHIKLPQASIRGIIGKDEFRRFSSGVKLKTE